MPVSFNVMPSPIKKKSASQVRSGIIFQNGTTGSGLEVTKEILRRTILLYENRNHNGCIASNDKGSKSISNEPEPRKPGPIIRSH